jgi:hypothetical protein
MVLRFVYLQVLLDFEPLPYLVWLMTPKHTRPLWYDFDYNLSITSLDRRDHILKLLKVVLDHQPNARRFIQAEGVKHLVTYLSQAHAGTSSMLLVSSSVYSAFLSQSNVKERHMSIEPKFAEAITVPANSPTRITESVSGTVPLANSDDDVAFGLIETQMNNGQLANICCDLIQLLLNRVPRLCKSITKTAEFQHMLQFLLSPDKQQAVKMMPVINQVNAGCFRL